MRHRKDQPDLFADTVPRIRPPAQQHSPTSVAAGDEIEPRAATLRRMVLDYIRSRGAEGATDEQVQEGLSLSGNTQRPRRTELEAMGQVRDSGRKRKTIAGRDAVVWIATEYASRNAG